MAISIINSTASERTVLTQSVFMHLRISSRSPSSGGSSVLNNTNSNVREYIYQYADGLITRQDLLDLMERVVRSSDINIMSHAIAIYVINRINNGGDILEALNLGQRKKLPKRMKNAVLISKPLPQDNEEELDEII